MAAKIPIQRYGETVAKYTGRLKRAYLKPYRDQIRAMRNEVEHELLKSPLGKKLWGGSSNLKDPGPGKPRFLIGAPKLRFSQSQNVFVGGFKVLGMAALMIAGGRTEKHTIWPQAIDRTRGKKKRVSRGEAIFAVGSGFRLKFTAGGQEVYALTVRHPGSRIRPVNVLRPVLEKRAARFAPEAVRALDELARESFR